jgi:hypothetical protein
MGVSLRILLAEGLNFNDKFDILLERRLSDVVEQGYTIVVWGIPGELSQCDAAFG